MFKGGRGAFFLYASIAHDNHTQTSRVCGGSALVIFGTRQC
jgi:hypothetical protein